MNISPELEHAITVRIIQEDAETIYSLLKSERNPIFGMEIIPYYALFVQSFQEYVGETLVSNEIAPRIKDIRNHIKNYTDSFGKSKRKISKTDDIQDAEFKSQLRFDFMKSWNIHLNLGTYWTSDGYIVGNTQQIADYLDITTFDKTVGKRQFDLAYQISSFVSSVRSGMEEKLSPPNMQRKHYSVDIPCYFDLNTRRNSKFFTENNSKDLNLFYLHLLCNMNFVKHILRWLLPDENTWLFRIEYIVTYYAYRALERLKNYCENNKDIHIDIKSVDQILIGGVSLFESKFRNCMMHYDLQNHDVLSAEYIECHFYGLVETCFNGISYHEYMCNLRKMSDSIINFLERQINTSAARLEHFDN